MATMKDIYMDIQEVLNENKGFFHDGTAFDGDNVDMFTECQYLYASADEMEQHYKLQNAPADNNKKVLWQIDDSDYKATALLEITEIINHLMFKTMLKALY